MKIAVACSDRHHPVFPHLEDWCRRQGADNEVELAEDADKLSGGDLLFLISYGRIVTQAVRARFGHVLVIHASELPQGRGWSPLVWQVLEGRHDIAVPVLEANDPVDSGAIWAQRWIKLEGHELFDEINEALFDSELGLMDFAVAEAPRITPQVQNESGATWYRRRKPEDSRLDPEKSLASQFDLLRVADPLRYPSFFELRGHRYEITIRKKD